MRAICSSPVFVSFRLLKGTVNDSEFHRILELSTKLLALLSTRFRSANSAAARRASFLPIPGFDHHQPCEVLYIWGGAIPYMGRWILRCSNISLPISNNRIHLLQMHVKDWNERKVPLDPSLHELAQISSWLLRPVPYQHQPDLP